MRKEAQSSLFFPLDEEEFTSQREIAKSVVDKIFGDEEFTEEQLSKLPLLKTSKIAELPSKLRMALITSYRADLPRFVFEMVSKWLIPGERIDIATFFSSKFRFFELDQESYLAFEIVICVPDRETLSRIRYALPSIEREIYLGAQSVYHAKRILELKGLSSDEKSVMVQERVTTLLHRFPGMFDYDFYLAMQKFLVSVAEEYRALRTSRFLARIVSGTYYLLSCVGKEVEKREKKRHLFLKLLPVKVQTPFGEKVNLGCFIALNFLKENEVFEERHLLKAVLRLVKNVNTVEESYFILERKDVGEIGFFVELERDDQQSFSKKQISLLRKELPAELKGSVESLVRPLFMPRNEEEVMKYIVTLSDEITSKNDMPQIAIIFDEQTDRVLSFTAVSVRPLEEGGEKTEDLMKKFSGYDVRLEKVKCIGDGIRQVRKEASLLRMYLSPDEFLRDDFSVDLYRARQYVVTYLMSMYGDVRDYNGGMISKQMEIFHSFRELIEKTGDRNDLLLENFFYALTPIELRAAVHPERLKRLYFLFRELYNDPKGGSRLMQVEDDKCLYVALCLSDSRAKRKLIDALLESDIEPTNLIRFGLASDGKHFIGFILFSESKETREKFLKKAEEALN